MAKKCRSNIGGQAVIEGVMMRGERSMATAVRDESGKIVVESKRIKSREERSFAARLPFVRGIVNFGGSLYTGVGTLMRAGAVFDAEESEPGKFESWLAKTLKVNIMSVVMTIGVLLGIALAVGLFIVLPQFFTGLINKFTPEGAIPTVVINLIDGAIRICIFVLYILLVSLMKDIRRVFMYHGAEHKTISAFEHGLELNVENVQKMSTVHDRCGTSFMFFVMVISILLFSLTGWHGNMWVRVLIRLALLPVVAGISYEFFRLLARFDNKFVLILKGPGLLLQKLTTKQPDDGMVEVAIRAFETVLQMDADPSIPEVQFDVKVLYAKTRKEIEEILGDYDDAAAEADWIFCEVTGKTRAELPLQSSLLSSKAERAKELAKRRAAGEPLQYILGYTEFYGYPIEVDSRVLIPRPETEQLTEQAIKEVKNGAAVLDLCCGSGCIALALKKERPDLQVTAADLSENAIEVARRNAEKNGAEIDFVASDLFAGLGQFDAVVSNPPYIPTADIAGLDAVVREHEPLSALDGGADGLDFYRKIIADAPAHLNAGGKLFLEVGIGQAQAVAALASAVFGSVEIKKDIEGIERFVIAAL